VLLVVADDLQVVMTPLHMLELVEDCLAEGQYPIVWQKDCPTMRSENFKKLLIRGHMLELVVMLKLVEVKLI
jgi:hypothetical protein